MDVLVKPHARETVVFGTVVDMPTPNMFIIETRDGRKLRVHVSLIRKFF